MPKTNPPRKQKKPSRFSHFGIGEERDFFLENLSSLLASGIPILDALTAVDKEIRSYRLKKIAQKLTVEIEAGQSLSAGLENTGLFSPHVASLIRAGERSGRLVENLKVIAVEQKKERVLRSKLRSAAMYPVFVLSLTLIIGAGIAWFILPKLAMVFSQMKIQLPFITDMLIRFGLFLGEYGIYAVPGFIIFIGAFLYFTFSFSKTRVIGEYIIFCIPGVRKLSRETEIARMGYLLGSLISAGLPPTDALDSLSQATPFYRYRKFYRFLHDGVSDGNSFRKNFALYKKSGKLLPATVQQLISAGEQSGTLSATLIRIGEDYEAKADTTAKDLAIILEPILLVIVWLGVIGVALAVVLPIYSLIGGLQTNP
ncbi:MAG: type II secretion system F family protein [Patescibacteria group bacterium]